MQVADSFMNDLRYLTKTCEWSDGDKEQIKKAVKASPVEFTQLLTSLAAAYRKGYKGPRNHGLAVYCAGNGIEHPYVGELAESMDVGPREQDVIFGMTPAEASA
jgi:hypothetical protein